MNAIYGGYIAARLDLRFELSLPISTLHQYEPKTWVVKKTRSKKVVLLMKEPNGFNGPIWSVSVSYRVVANIS